MALLAGAGGRSGRRTRASGESDGDVRRQGRDRDGGGVGHRRSPRVERLLDDGAAVVGADLAEPDRRRRRRASTSTCDVTDEAAVAALVAAAVDRFGRLDGVVNAAGVAGGGAGAPRRRRRVAPRHRHQPHRHVPRRQARDRADARPGAASTASGARSSPSPASRASRAPPAAAPTTRRRAASSCSPRTWPSTTGRQGIRANAICPGFIDTPMTAGASSAWTGMEDVRGADASTSTSCAASAEPEEIAAAAAFLLSRDASLRDRPRHRRRRRLHRRPRPRHHHDDGAVASASDGQITGPRRCGRRCRGSRRVRR